MDGFAIDNRQLSSGGVTIFDAVPWNFTLRGQLGNIDKGFFINALRQINDPIYDFEVINSLL